jgi:hypothetical protein
VRLVGAPQSIDDARARVRAAALRWPGVPLTGFSLADLMQLVQGDHLALADLALALSREGLEAVADVPLDDLDDTEQAAEVILAVTTAGWAPGAPPSRARPSPSGWRSSSAPPSSSRRPARSRRLLPCRASIPAINRPPATTMFGRSRWRG